MTPDLQRARSAIASEIGPDVAEFTPEGEKHFVAEAALLAMGGTFLYAFFKGVVEKAGESAGKKLGEPVGNALGGFFGGLFSKLRHQPASVGDTDLEAARQEAAAVVKQGGLSPEEVAAIGQAVAAAMAAVLAQQADGAVSQRVAQRVRTEGLSVLGAAT
ncbi:MAG: hypothetical protein ABI072_06100 [Edaphobacter sp.]